MKKIYLVIAMLGMSLYLSGCSNKDVLVQIGKEKITVTDFIDSIADQQSTREALIKQTIYKVAIDEVGEKVTDMMVGVEYKKTAAQYGDSFEEMMKASGLTEETLKNQIRGELAIDELIKKEVKITDKARERIWKDFHPEIKAKILQLENKEEAEKVRETLQDSKKFDGLVKEYPFSDVAQVDNQGIVSFDSNYSYLNDETKNQIFALKDGEISNVISATIKNGYRNKMVYLIVQMEKNVSKGSDMAEYKSEIDQIIYDEKISDASFRSEVIAKMLKEANVVVEDAAFKGTFDGYDVKEAEK